MATDTPAPDPQTPDQPAGDAPAQGEMAFFSDGRGLWRWEADAEEPMAPLSAEEVSTADGWRLAGDVDLDQVAPVDAQQAQTVADALPWDVKLDDPPATESLGATPDQEETPQDA